MWGFQMTKKLRFGDVKRIKLLHHSAFRILPVKHAPGVVSDSNLFTSKRLLCLPDIWISHIYIYMLCMITFALEVCCLQVRLFGTYGGNNPNSKVHGANMNRRPHMGPMLAPWNLLSGKSCVSMTWGYGTDMCISACRQYSEYTLVKCTRKRRN